MVKALILVLLATPLCGCAMNRAPLLGGLPCSVGPFIPDKGASTRWTRGEQEQLSTINNSGAVLCGWKPPKK